MTIKVKIRLKDFFDAIFILRQLKDVQKGGGGKGAFPPPIHVKGGNSDITLFKFETEE